MCAFDPLEFNGEVYREKPLLERKRRLARLLKCLRPGIGYVTDYLEHACKLKLEGFVSKRVSGPSSWPRASRGRPHEGSV